MGSSSTVCCLPPSAEAVCTREFSAGGDSGEGVDAGDCSAAMFSPSADWQRTVISLAADC